MAQLKDAGNIPCIILTNLRADFLYVYGGHLLKVHAVHFRQGALHAFEIDVIASFIFWRLSDAFHTYDYRESYPPLYYFCSIFVLVMRLPNLYKRNTKFCPEPMSYQVKRLQSSNISLLEIAKELIITQRHLCRNDTFLLSNEILMGLGFRSVLGSSFRKWEVLSLVRVGIWWRHLDFVGHNVELLLNLIVDKGETLCVPPKKNL